MWVARLSCAELGTAQPKVIFLNSFLLICSVIAALCELFDKADTGGDGTISIEEYVAMCDEYGIELTDDHMEGVRAIANEDGEVRGVIREN